MNDEATIATNPYAGGNIREIPLEEIWRAADQQWYYEEAKGHIDARAVRCHDCRLRTRSR